MLTYLANVWEADNKDFKPVIKTIDTDAFFDPRKNPIVKKKGQKLTRNMVYEFAKVVCTKQNIIDNYKFFFKRHASEYKQVVEQLPETFNFINMFGLYQRSVQSYITYDEFYLNTSFFTIPYTSSPNAYESISQFFNIQIPFETMYASDYRNCFVHNMICYIRGDFNYYDNEGRNHGCVNSEMLTQVEEDYSIVLINSDVRSDYMECRVVGNINCIRYGKIYNYTQNVLNTLPNNFKEIKKKSNERFYGIELETATNYTPQELLVFQGKNPWFICKSDGSISGKGRYRLELVSLPMTLEEHKKNWHTFFEHIDYKQFDITKKTNNGFHVHICHDQFTKLHLKKFTYFFINPCNEAFILAVSERTKSSLNSWSPLPDLKDYTNLSQIFCKSDDIVKNRRGCIHFSNKGSIEVRMFKGLVCEATMIKNLEFVDSVIDFTEQTSLSKLGAEDYINWLNKCGKKYSCLREFFARLVCADFIEGGKIYKFLIGNNEPDEVIEQINKSNFKVKPLHIAFLNSKFGQRIFYIENGKVATVKKDVSLLNDYTPKYHQRFSVHSKGVHSVCASLS